LQQTFRDQLTVGEKGLMRLHDTVNDLHIRKWHPMTDCSAAGQSSSTVSIVRNAHALH
jgi:hypothetical protein